MLEDLDFAADSDSEGGPILAVTDGEDGEDDVEELMDVMRDKRALFARMQGEGEEEEADDLWRKAGLEDGELEALLADAENEEIGGIGEEIQKGKKKRRGRGKDKKDSVAPAKNGVFAPLVEPAFVSSAPKNASMQIDSDEDDDALGDPTSLADADASDKERRKRSLRFHTSKIAATSARRSAARTQRLGGDEDVPYRDHKAARDAALWKNGSQGTDGEGLEPVERKRARDVSNEAGDDGDGDGDGDVDKDAEGYYNLVKRRRTKEKSEKEAEHQAVQAAKLYVHAIRSS